MSRTNIKYVTCDFCGRKVPTNPKIKEDLMFLGGIDDNFSLCGACINNAKEVMSETDLNNPYGVTTKKDEEITPKLLKAKLDEWIIDQEVAKRTLSIAIYDHYKRINQSAESNEQLPMEKSNIILAGATGSGKSGTVKALAKQLNLPLHIDDATTITISGYSGRNVEDMLSRLIAEADGDIELAQKGIILLDEADKLKKATSGNGGRDVKGEGVQQSILKMAEGGLFSVKYKGNEYTFDTTNVLFILAGAFDGIEKIIAKRLNSKTKTTGGFTGSIATRTEINYNDMIVQIHPEDLKEYGMMAELLGRFPIITPLQELSEEALVKILTEPKNAIVKQMVKSFALDNIELSFSESALIQIAKQAKERKTGARALRSIVESVIADAKYDCPGTNIAKVIVKDDLSLQYIEH